MQYTESEVDLASRFTQATHEVLTGTFTMNAGKRLAPIAAPNRTSLTHALRAIAPDDGVDVPIHELETESGWELPDPMLRAPLDTHAALISTTRSHTRTDGMQSAAATGTRATTNVDLTEVQRAKSLLADHDAIAARAAHDAKRIDAACEVRTTSEAGNDPTFSVAHPVRLNETERYHAPGMVGNLPAGEAACGIHDGTENGTRVVDGSRPGLGLITSPLTVRDEAGVSVAVEGERAGELEVIPGRHDPGARHLAEHELEMNDTMTLQGNARLDEKVTGTVHVAVGNDVSFGGSNDVDEHADAVVRSPTLILEGIRVALPQ